MIPSGDFDPQEEDLRLLILNDSGIVYAASVPSFSLVPSGQGSGWHYESNNKPKYGITDVLLRWASSSGQPDVLRISLKAYGQVTSPSTDMMVGLSLGGRWYWAMNDTWSRKQVGNLWTSDGLGLEPE